MERTRKPTSPGEIIKMHYLEPLSMSIADLAKSLEVTPKLLSAVVEGKRQVDWIWQCVFPAPWKPALNSG